MRNFGREPSAGPGGPPRGPIFGFGMPLPPMVKRLLIANFALFLLPLLPGVDEPLLRAWFALVPAEVFAEGHVWQLGTYMFLHGSFVHIAVNMLMLWMFGSSVEMHWGSRPFLWYYLVCGLGGALTQWITGPTSEAAVVGASAAVLGVIVAFAMIDPDRYVYIYFLFPVKVKYLVWFLVVADLLAAFSGQQNRIANFAHLGGMLTGWLYLKQDWRLGTVGRKVRARAARQKMATNARRAEKQQQTRDEQMAEVNRILEKINREGMDSLTQDELRTLREASRH
jgi:membrane associated rhomboid family serine protease